MGVFNQIPTAELQIDTITQTVVSVTTASSVVLAANAERKFFRLKNQDTGTQRIFIRLNASAATSTNSFELLDSQEYTEGVGAGGMVYTGEIRAISSSGSKNLYVEERS